MLQSIFKHKFSLFYLLFAFAMVVLSFFGLHLIFYVLFITSFLLFFLIIFREIVYKYLTKGAPYVPTGSEEIRTMVSFAKKYDCRYAADLGSGTGDICFAFSKNKIKIDGYEINPILVFISMLRNFFQKDKARFYIKNFWKVNLSKYDCIVVFGIGYIMEELEEKILKEITAETIVISHRFAFPNLKAVDNLGKVHVYKVTPKL